MAEPAKWEDSALDFDVLEAQLQSLSALEQRCVLCLLGLCLGDVIGLPFELSSHRKNRELADKAAEDCEAKLRYLLLDLITERLGRAGPTNAYARTYSDDTTVADAKISALALAAAVRHKDVFQGSPPNNLLAKSFLAELLAWADGPAKGRLFQGYGGFTQGLLKPKQCTELPKHDVVDVDLPGCSTWPQDWFEQYVEAYCSGDPEIKGSVSSWGNGVVMSYAPQVIAKLLMRDGDLDQYSCLANTHRHPDARMAAELLDDVLQVVLTGQVESCQELSQAVRATKAWRKILESNELDRHIYPLLAFDAFLEQGDCEDSHVHVFITALTGQDSPPFSKSILRNRGCTHAHNMGQLLRTAANWDDEFASQFRLSLNTGEPVRFSQRALNTVLIALWCCSGSRSSWDWISRVLYIGGDSDTIGAVCGQIAGPLLKVCNVCQEFKHFAATADCPFQRPCARVSSAATYRYFQRSILFCRAEWSELASCARLVDPHYPDLTNSHGTKAIGPSSDLKVLWLDEAFETGHLRRTAASRRHAAHEAEAAGLMSVSRACQLETARTKLQQIKDGNECLDAVVAELHVGDKQMVGLELLQIIDSLWCDSITMRPLFCLLTPHHDKDIIKLVKKHPHTKLVRCDRPQEIVQTLESGYCAAARVQCC